MKGFSRFIHFINWVVATVCAVILARWGIEQLLSQQAPLESITPPLGAAIGGGALLVILNVLWLVFSVRSSRSVTYLIFEKEGSGSLKVSVDAVENMLTKTAKAIPEVNDAHVMLKLVKGGKMPKEAIAHCVFTDVPNLFAVQDSVRQTMANRYQDVFPGEELQIEIIVDHLRPEVKESREQKKKKKRDEGEESPFPGPRYPVG